MQLVTARSRGLLVWWRYALVLATNEVGGTGSRAYPGGLSTLDEVMELRDNGDKDRSEFGKAEPQQWELLALLGGYSSTRLGWRRRQSMGRRQPRGSLVVSRRGGACAVAGRPALVVSEPGCGKRVCRGVNEGSKAATGEVAVCATLTGSALDAGASSAVGPLSISMTESLSFVVVLPALLLLNAQLGRACRAISPGLAGNPRPNTQSTQRAPGRCWGGARLLHRRRPWTRRASWCPLLCAQLTRAGAGQVLRRQCVDVLWRASRRVRQATVGCWRRLPCG